MGQQKLTELFILRKVVKGYDQMHRESIPKCQYTEYKNQEFML